VTQTEVVAEGRLRTLGIADSPFEIATDWKNAPSAAIVERSLRLHGHPVYSLCSSCQTCPPLFRRLAELPESGLPSVTEFKDRLANGLEAVDEDVLAVVSGVLPLGEYVPLVLRLWPRLVLPGEPGDYFSEERLVAFPEHEPWAGQPSGVYYRGTTMQLSDSVELFEFVLPLIAASSLNPERVRHYETLIRGGASPTALALSILDGSLGRDTDLPMSPFHWALGHFLLDGNHKIQAAALLGVPLTVMTVLSTTMGKARSETVLQLVSELARRRWTGPEVLR
jgi:hypothetical protein